MYFNDNGVFGSLWVCIPSVRDYFDYCGLANQIDDARCARELTAKEEETLLAILDCYCELRGIPVVDKN